jgi:hypothetical protein
MLELLETITLYSLYTVTTLISIILSIIALAYLVLLARRFVAIVLIHLFYKERPHGRENAKEESY